ncbi:cytochrome c peroxidase [Myxococcaceae bacterium GXIMD 01537]
MPVPRTLVRALGSLLLLAPLACDSVGDSLCEVPGCEFSKEEWNLVQSLANLPDPPPDPSNAYVGNEAAAKLGQKFYFDTAFSGAATNLDTMRRPTQYARPMSVSTAGAHFGNAINVSCATCHNPARAGSDFTSQPSHVSIGAGWYDVNSQQTVNSAYYDVIYWNGRNDSLWSQIIAVNESFVSMNSNRAKNAWRIADKYRAEYEAIFGAMPISGTSLEQYNRTDTTAGSATFGQCALVAGACPADCREETLTGGAKACYLRFPLQGKPGTTAGCQRGLASEPFGDAFDCMTADDQKAINRVYVNFAKAIAAYEYKLISRNAPFDQWVNAGADTNLISAEAKRGARLYVGKAGCINCHNTPFMSDNGFHNVGVPQVGTAVPTEEDCVAGGTCDCVAGRNCLPWGGYDGLKKLQSNGFRRTSQWSDAPTDTSRERWYTLELTDPLKGTWRTPSLRDVAITPPYMHNGLYRTLQEVVWHYNQGGGGGAFPGPKSVRVKPLYLTDEEQTDLVAFLQTLTGEKLPAELSAAPAP